MADFEMISLVQNHRPGLHSPSSSLEPPYFAQSQDIGTYYHDTASSIALLSSHPVDIEEEARTCTLPINIDPATDLDPDPTSTSTNKSSSWFQLKDARSWWSDWWLPEILALIFSIVCLASIVYVLKMVDGKPLSDWHSLVQDGVPGGYSLSIAPNSVISFLSTLAKSCLGFTATACISQVKWLHIQKKKGSLTSLQVFDDASRGPLGAVGLFFTAETASSVAAVGALITLAALVIDPFTQLVVTYPLHQVSTEVGVAVVYTSSTYDSGATMQLAFDSVNETHLNVPMLGAIYNGIYDLNLNDTHICSTGNCEWDNWISSFAVCSKCTDVTDQVTKSCGQLSGDTITYESDLNPNNSLCKLTTPSGLKLSTLLYFDEYTENYTSTMITNSVETLSRDDGMTLLQMATAMARNDHIDPARVPLTAPRNGSSYAVSECSLHWCVQHDTNVRIVNGSVANRDTWLIRNINGTVSVRLDDLWDNPVWNASFVHDPLPKIFKSSEPAPDFNIYINHADTLGIRDFLASIFDTSWDASNLVSSVQSPLLAQTLYASQNVSLMMDHLAASMTKHVRASRSAKSVRGRALAYVTYVEVHRGWLSLLIATTGMSVIFLLVVIILSHLGDTFLWKSNSLALLFHGLDGWSPTELDATKVAAMTRMASTMEGQLKRDSDGLLKIVRS